MLSAITLDETLINYEVALFEAPIESVLVNFELNKVLPDWNEQRYSIHCLKCGADMNMSIANERLEVKGMPVVVEDMFFVDLVVELDQYDYEVKFHFLKLYGCGK